MKSKPPVQSKLHEDKIRTEELYDQEEVIDLREYLIILKKWRWVIVLVTLCAIATSGVVSFFILTPIYETKSVLMVVQPVSSLDRRTPTNQDDLESVVNTMSSIPQLTMNTYVAQIKNNTLMKQTLKAMGDQGQDLSPSALQRIVNAQSIKDTNLIEMTVTHPNPQMAADIANTLQVEFVKFISDNNQEQMKKSVDFLQKQMGVEEEKLEEASTELQRLEAEARNPIFLQKQIENKYADLSKYQSLANQARYEFQQTLAGRDRLKEQLDNVTATILVDKASGKEEINPAYVSLNDSLIQKETELAEKAAQLEAALEIINVLSGEIRGLQAEASEKKLAMDRLSETLDQTKQTYNLLNEKWTQTQIIQAVNLGETYLLPVSPAPVPTAPVKPNKMLNMTIAGILGLMLAIMLVFLLEFLDNTIKDAEEVRKIFDLPILGTIPILDDLEMQNKAKHQKQKTRLRLKEEDLRWMNDMG